MDIYCTTPGCNEPWDTYEISVALAEELETTPAEAMRQFRAKGCAAFPGNRCADTAGTSLHSEATAALFELMPDDPDGVAAMLEDFDSRGML